MKLIGILGVASVIALYVVAQVLRHRRQKMDVHTETPYWNSHYILWFTALIPYLLLLDANRKNNDYALLAICFGFYLMGLGVWWLNDRVFLSKTNRKKLLSKHRLSYGTPLELGMPLALLLAGVIVYLVLDQILQP